MSSQNSGAKQSGKRRKVEEGTGESREDDASLRDFCEGSDQRDVLILDLSCTREVFAEKVKDMAAVEWDRACKMLRDRLGEGADDLDDPDTPAELCERCREAASSLTTPASFLIRVSRRALRECSRRYLETLRDVDSGRVEKEGMAARSAEIEESRRRLAEEKREVELERDQLRAALTAKEDQLCAALATRGEERGRGRTPPPLDTEPEEVEMREGVSPTPSSPGDVTIIPAILEALEGWFEAKWARMVSHGAPPSTEGESGAPETANRSGSWAGAVGRKAGKKPSLTGTAAPRPGERGGAARTSTAAHRGTEAITPNPPKKTGRKRERKWPAAPRSAVVAINPLPGGTLTGVELIREAQQALSLEELNIPPLEIRRSKMEGYLLGVNGQDAKEKADRLASGLRGLPGAAGVAVTRPTKRLDIRVSGLEAGVSPAAVAQSVAAAGGCSADEIKTGAVRGSPGGMGALWMRCPAVAAVTIAKGWGGRGPQWSCSVPALRGASGVSNRDT